MDNKALAMMSCNLNDNLNFIAKTDNNTQYAIGKVAPLSAWGYWRDDYYPEIIKQSYPVYIQEKAQDKGKQAFEIIKALQDKKLMKLEKVSDFIEAMDVLIKTL